MKQNDTKVQWVFNTKRNINIKAKVNHQIHTIPLLKQSIG